MTTPPGPADASRRPAEVRRGAGAAAGRSRRLSDLDDADAPVYTIGQAAELLGSSVAGLRRLDESAGITPHRSSGGQRRYSRHQLEHAGRMLELIDEGTPITAAGRIADLERQVAGLEGEVAGLEGEVAGLKDEMADLRATNAPATPATANEPGSGRGGTAGGPQPGSAGRSGSEGGGTAGGPQPGSAGRSGSASGGAVDGLRAHGGGTQGREP